MPIAATQSNLQSIIMTALSMGSLAEGVPISAMISAGVGTTAGAGLMPSAPSPIPVIPSGVSIARSTFESAFKMGKGSSPDVFAEMFTKGVAQVAPQVPPIGYAVCKSVMASALKMGVGAGPSVTAQVWSSAIISYFLAGTAF